MPICLITLPHLLLWDLFESHVPVESITVMVQKEVADRMQTGPGSKDYGALSLAVQYYANPEIVANVPPNCFMPRPKVGSAVIRLTRHQRNPPVQAKDEKLMFRTYPRHLLTREERHWQTDLKNSQELELYQRAGRAVQSRHVGLPTEYPRRGTGPWNSLQQLADAFSNLKE